MSGHRSTATSAQPLTVPSDGNDAEVELKGIGSAIRAVDEVTGSTPKVEAAEVTFASSMRSLWRSIFWFNVLSITFVPLGILSYALKWGDIATFVLNFCAIIPLAKILDYTTDQLSMRVGQTIGGLLNASFGNAVELLVGILALVHGELRVVQASLIGSILSNLLLVLGLCFICGALFPQDKTPILNKTLVFDVDQANVSTGMLSVVFLGFIIPAAFHFSSSSTSAAQDADITSKTLSISRGTALLLFSTYVGFLVYTLYTHALHKVATVEDVEMPATDLANETEDDDDEEETPEILAIVAVIGLVVATVFIGVNAEFLVDSLDGLAKTSGMSKTFIGVIILPIVGNAAEHVTSVSAAMRNKMNLVISVAVGSALQIALCVAPVLVLIGWIIGQGLSLDFQVFESAVLFVTIFVVTTLISDGRTNWFEGWILLTSYVIVAIAFYYATDA